MNINKVGLMTTFVQNLYKINEFSNTFSFHSVNILFKKGNFPKIDLKEDVIIICTGTGIAPIRYFLWDRFNKHIKNKDQNLGKSVLIYGCRNKKKDYLYEKEIEIYKENKDFNFSCFNAFSRDQESKVYVQNLIKENSLLLKEMIFDKNGKIVLIGNSKILPKYVDKAICFALKKESNQFSNMTDEEILKYLNILKQKQIYYTETW